MKYYLIDRGQLRTNIQTVIDRAGGADVIYGVVKGNGYGLGLLELASALEEAGITKLAITEPEDAVTLRENGFITQEILMLRATSDPDEIRTLVNHGVVCTIGSTEDAVALSAFASAHQIVIEAHIKIDTGMHRLGERAEHIDEIYNMFYLKNLQIDGMFTHLYVADTNTRLERNLTLRQIAVFHNMLSRLEKRGIVCLKEPLIK